MFYSLQNTDVAVYVLFSHGSTWLYLMLLNSITLHHGSTWLYLMLLNSITLYHGSTSLYLTLLHSTTLALLHSTTLDYGSTDKFIRFKEVLMHGSPRTEDDKLVGSTLFYMLLRAKTMIDANIGVSLSRFSLAPHSGWKETLQKFGYKYIKAVIPEQNPHQERQRETEENSGYGQGDIEAA